ncbi:MAG: hypothetical protein LBC97_15440 [Bifidobacteriaceae bacterium]|jgi:folate-binding protein YgfZ|nr:hypothetical protein [Bifidobacteriaceae bacterium]
MGRHDLAAQRAFDARERVYALPDAVRVVHLAGPDSLRLLSALTTLPPSAGLPPGGAEALALDANGHIMFGFAVWEEPDGETTRLTLVTDGSADALADLINSRRFRLRAEAASRPDLKTLVTPAAAPGVNDRSFADPWPGPAGAPERGSGNGPGRSPGSGPDQSSNVGRAWPRYAVDSPHPGGRWKGLAVYVYDPSQASPLPIRLEDLGYRRIDAGNLEPLRIAAWRPLASREAADGKTLPHELDWLRSAVPLNSGCYPGQETVAKIINVGKPPRRLVFLHLDGSDAAWPDRGAAVYAFAQDGPGAGPAAPAGAQPVGRPQPARAANANPEAPPALAVWPQSDPSGNGAADHSRPAGEPPPSPQLVGRVTSVGVHHELGPIALALVKRSLPENARLAVAAPGAPGGLVAAGQTPVVPRSGESDARPARRAAPAKLSLRRRG